MPRDNKVAIVLMIIEVSVVVLVLEIACLL